jgi:hypothetical protein
MTMKRRGAVMVAVGLALTVGLFGWRHSSPGLVDHRTYTNIAFGSPGTEGPVTGLQLGLVGPIGSPWWAASPTRPPSEQLLVHDAGYRHHRGRRPRPGGQRRWPDPELPGELLRHGPG